MAAQTTLLMPEVVPENGATPSLGNSEELSNDSFWLVSTIVALIGAVAFFVRIVVAVAPIVWLQFWTLIKPALPISPIFLDWTMSVFFLLLASSCLSSATAPQRARLRQKRERNELIQRERRSRAAAENRERRIEAETRTAEAGARARFIQLHRRYERRAHLDDPKFLDDHARKYGAALLQRHDEIVREYAELQDDAPVIALLKSEAPHILARATWRMEALARAEKLDVQETRKKLTPEQFRVMLTARVRHRAQDKIAKMRAGVVGVREAETMLDTLGITDPNLREKLLGPMREEMLSEDDEAQGTILGKSNGRKGPKGV